MSTSAAGQPAPASERFLRDPLTGLPDEHLLRLQLPLEFARARDQERNAALLAIKLDDIVGINERWGRARGDEALRSVAQVLQNVRGQAGRENQVQVQRLRFGCYRRRPAPRRRGPWPSRSTSRCSNRGASPSA
jgi:hypothetical protein